MKRIYVPNKGGGREDVAAALAIGIIKCKGAQINTICLVTPKNDLHVLSSIVGERIAKILLKGQSYTYEGIRIVHASVTNLKKQGNPGAVIAFYLSLKDMLVLDGLQSVKLSVYLPWLESEGDEWASKWGAEVDGKAAENTAINLPAEVVNELSQLTSHVNLSTGLGHPYDLRDAKATFERLRRSGVSWMPFEIEKWAVRNGWGAVHATHLATLSKNYVK